VINIILNKVALNSAADMHAVLTALDDEFFQAYAGDESEAIREQIKGLLRLAEGLEIVFQDNPSNH
jgi:hypothetical protein